MQPITEPLAMIKVRPQLASVLYKEISAINAYPPTAFSDAGATHRFFFSPNDWLKPVPGEKQASHLHWLKPVPGEKQASHLHWHKGVTYTWSVTIAVPQYDYVFCATVAWYTSNSHETTIFRLPPDNGEEPEWNHLRIKSCDCTLTRNNLDVVPPFGMSHSKWLEIIHYVYHHLPPPQDIVEYHATMESRAAAAERAQALEAHHLARIQRVQEEDQALATQLQDKYALAPEDLVQWQEELEADLDFYCDSADDSM